jgi:hypothetical protein
LSPRLGKRLATPLQVDLVRLLPFCGEKLRGPSVVGSPSATPGQFASLSIDDSEGRVAEPTAHLGSTRHP